MSNDIKPRRPISIGTQVGRLTVKELTEERRYGGYRVYLCLCSCGNEITATSASLRNGHTQSCGCLQKDAAKITQAENLVPAIRRHGYAKTGHEHEIYHIWVSMKSRCNNSDHPEYHNYGGRGITVCDRWQGPNGFVNFLADMGERPESLTLERVDNEKGYSPENCVWDTWTAQNNNKRNNKKRIRRL